MPRAQVGGSMCAFGIGNDPLLDSTIRACKNARIRGKH